MTARFLDVVRLTRDLDGVSAGTEGFVVDDRGGRLIVEISDPGDGPDLVYPTSDDDLEIVRRAAGPVALSNTPLLLTVTFGDIVFDYVTYDACYDSLRLHVGHPRPVDDYDMSEEGDPISFEDGRLVGIEILSARRQLQRQGELRVTLRDGTVLRSPDVRAALEELGSRG
jgi:hypothetical protein